MWTQEQEVPPSHLTLASLLLNDSLTATKKVLSKRAGCISINDQKGETCLFQSFSQEHLEAT